MDGNADGFRSGNCPGPVSSDASVRLDGPERKESASASGEELLLFEVFLFIALAALVLAPDVAPDVAIFFDSFVGDDPPGSGIGAFNGAFGDS